MVGLVFGHAGFTAIDISPLDVQVQCGDLQSTIEVLIRVGAVGVRLRAQPEARACCAGGA